MNNSDSPEITTNLRVKKQRTLMLVDDSETDRAIYQRYLRADAGYQYTFVEAQTGEEGFDRYQQSQPDIILLDYLLPDMDGLEWLNQLQQQYHSPCPIIILTGQGDENIAVQFIKMGAVDYFIKSQITAEKLKLSIRREIELRELQQKKRDLAARFVLKDKELIQSKNLYQQEFYQKKNLERIIDRAPIVVYAKDVDVENQQSGKLWLVNQEFNRIFGLTESEIIGKTDRELFPPEIADTFAANDRRIIESGKPLTTEEKVVHANGELHSYLSLKFPLFDEQQQIVSIVGIAQDTTIEKQAKNELLKSKTRFRSTFEQAAVGIAHVTIDGRWLEVNQKLCQIVGYSKQELLRKSFQDITHPQDLDKDLSYMRQILAGAIKTYSTEKRYIHKNGSHVWIDLTVSLVRNLKGEPDYFISVIEDISDRKKLELSLQKSLRRLFNLHRIDKAILAAEKPQAIAQTVIEDLQNLVTCKRISIVTFEWERKISTILATQGTRSNTLKSQQQMPLEVWQEVINRLQDGDEYQNYITVYLGQSPSLSPIAITLEGTDLDCFIAFPLRSKSNLLGILKIWVDNREVITVEELMTVEEISHQVAISLEQARLHKQTQNYALELESKVAQRTAQIEEINQELKAFTYSISHDLKAPLRAIQGFALALQEDYGDCLEDLGQEYTSRLISCTQQMTQLIEDLLAYSRLSRQEIQLKPVACSTVVSKVIEQLEPEIIRTQAKITVAEPLLTMIGNQVILIQIISNLLSNAIKFIPPGIQPQIHIRTEVRTEDTLDSPATKIRLWIEDNGIGIKPQHQKRIFGVFERLHGNEAYPGTGIGLAIVKKGMERLGGRFGVESESNQGSRFWIEGQAR